MKIYDVMSTICYVIIITVLIIINIYGFIEIAKANHKEAVILMTTPDIELHNYNLPLPSNNSNSISR